jgi:arginine-tRNA-protein transferase
MDRNFRRAGHVVYRPRCAACSACRQTRVPVADFRPSRSQRRCARRNADLEISLAAPRLTAEKHALYRRYLDARHPGHPEDAQGRDLQSLAGFLYASCVDTAEVEYRDRAGALLAVSIVDVSSRAVSSVYHFFAPEQARRGLGTFSVLAEIELCRAASIPWYYLGYWIEGAPSMSYKARFLPHEVLQDGTWRRVESAPDRLRRT